MVPPSTNRIFLGALFALFAAYLLSLAIQYTDSDLWYHLAGGRHLFDTGNLYNPLVVSYLEPDRDFINYFWGFQALAWTSWLLAGETGLIVLKALLFLASAWFALKVLLEGRPASELRILPLLALMIIIGILCARSLAFRPHLTSYVMIPLFIYILGYREKLLPFLPLLTVIWVNLHGVVWVVGALICGSYFLQRVADYYIEGRDLKSTVWIVLCAPALLLNPNGIYVLQTPFLHDPDLHLVVLELGRISFDANINLLSGINLNLLILLLFVLVTASAFKVIPDARHNIAPLLLAAGALVLLLMARRFVWEWSLLSLPLLATGLRYWRGPEINPATLAVPGLFLTLLAQAYWPWARHGLQHYPLDRESLPWATTEFIRINGLEGRYAIEPSYAGYIEFELGTAVQIHMDMQFPPFTSMDIHEINTAMRSATGLSSYVKKYSPVMLGVKKTLKTFPVQRAYELGYVPVFFDDRVVLFIDRTRYPQVADNHELKSINPFNESVMASGHLAPGIAELERMLNVVDSANIRLSLVGLLLEQGLAERAAVYLDELKETDPDDLSTIYYSARVHHLNNNCAEAIADYEHVIEHSDASPKMYRQAAECHFLLGNHRQAFQHFSIAINPYKDDNPDALVYFQYALSAVGAGEPGVARRLLTMTRRFAPESDLAPEISTMLEELESH